MTLTTESCGKLRLGIHPTRFSQRADQGCIVFPVGACHGGSSCRPWGIKGLALTEGRRGKMEEFEQAPGQGGQNDRVGSRASC